MIRTTASIFFASVLLALPVVASAADKGAADDAAIAKIWDKTCRNCHGTDGSAQTRLGRKYKADNLRDPAWQAKHTDEEIRHAIENGKPKTHMKAFKRKYTSEQIAGLVRHIRSFASGTKAAAEGKADAPKGKMKAEEKTDAGSTKAKEAAAGTKGASPAKTAAD